MDGEKKKDFIRFEQVSKVYKAGEVEIPALRSADFTISEGEFAVIVGASGAGKTTLLNILGGMDTLTSGRVFVDEREISSLDSKSLTVYRRYDVGFVFQFYNLVPNLTALENVELAAQICREPLDAESVLQEVGLGDRTGNFPAQLSGGEQQRVAIGRALITRPSLILADEPTGNLDSQNSSEVIALLKETSKKYEQTIIMITHNRSIAQTADRVLQVSDGALTDFGRCRE